MRIRAAMLLAGLGLGLALAGSMRARGQETQADPTPVPPLAPQTTKQPEAPQSGTQQSAPVERRASKPVANGDEPVAGPLTKAAEGGASSGSSSQTAERVNGDGAVATIRVQTRLVNVALNVVDAHGAPVGGFEKKDFALFEDGRPQTIAVFEREATSPLSIVLAIDSSETVLTSDRLEREAAKRFIRAILRPQDEIDLMDFADTVREIVPFTNEAKRAEQGLGELKQGDETALYNAVYLASQRLATTRDEAGRRRVLVVISDGGDSVTGEPYEQAVEQAQRAGAMIYAIIVVPIAADAGRNTGGEHALIQMAEDTGGKYYYVEDPSDLEPAFRHVSEDLRTQYLLGYYAPLGAGAASGFRRIKVTLAGGAKEQSYSLRYRTGYFADSQ
jgi:Ca-activated chloride channel homolog